jgi:MarR family transcriptional regulator, organic hydroperoxide resistance regulator
MDPVLELALLIKAGDRGLQRQINEAMAPLGVSGPQSEAIALIGGAGPLSLKQLGGLLVAESGHPSRLVDRLVEAGLVERRASDDDRRQVQLSLTSKGRRMEARVNEVRGDLIELGRSLVGETDLSPVLEILRQLVATTPYAPLVERRRDLEGESAPGHEPLPV